MTLLAEFLNKPIVGVSPPSAASAPTPTPPNARFPGFSMHSVAEKDCCVVIGQLEGKSRRMIGRALSRAAWYQHADWLLALARPRGRGLPLLSAFYQVTS